MSEIGKRINLAEQQKRRQKEQAEALRRTQETAGAPVITPRSGAGLGMTPDQAKMMGTKQQKEAALQKAATQQEKLKAAPQEELLATELGEQTFENKKADIATEKAREFSQKMSGFGSLGERVEAIVLDQFDTANKKIAVGAFELDDAQLDEWAKTPEDKETVRKAFEDFDKYIREGDNEKAYEALASASSSFSNPSASAITMFEDVYKMSGDDLTDAVADSIANGIIDPGEVSIGKMIDTGILNKQEDGIYEELGGMTEEDLHSMLGPDWRTLTPDQIGDQIEAKVAGRMGREDRYIQILNDPSASDIAKEQARLELEKMGAYGGIQNEQEAREIAQQATQSGKIMFGGMVRDITDLLSDESIKADVLKYIDDPDYTMTDPATGKEVKWKDLPGNKDFAAWIDEELAAIKEVKGNLKTALNQFNEIQKKNESFISTGGGLSEITGVPVSEELMNVLGFTKGLHASEFSPEQNKLFKALMDKGNTSAIQSLNTLVRSGDQSIIDELKTLSQEDPDTFIEILTNKDLSQQFTKLATLEDDWARVDKSNVNKMLETLLGVKPGELGNINTLLADLQIRAGMGDKNAWDTYDMLKPILDQDGDGKPDDPAMVQKAISAVISRQDLSLKNLINSKATNEITTLKDVATTSKEPNFENPQQAEIYKSIKDIINNPNDDGYLSATDLDKAREIMRQSYPKGSKEMVDLLRYFREYGGKHLNTDKGHLDWLVADEVTQYTKNNVFEGVTDSPEFEDAGINTASDWAMEKVRSLPLNEAKNLVEKIATNFWKMYDQYGDQRDFQKDLQEVRNTVERLRTALAERNQLDVSDTPMMTGTAAIQGLG